MCGFAGFWMPEALGEDAPRLARSMGDSLRHRGPDDSGEWLDPALGLAIGFRRLAILDLSERGHQPMVSADKRYVLAFNGEIYNHQALREELAAKGCRFRSRSDAEVLVEGVSHWGFGTLLQRCVGMFALVLVDLQERQLLLARDRLGEKPLYYGWSKGCFFFGSELKAFRPHPAFSADVDRQALALYLRYAYVPSPYCILSGFKKLPAGSILSMPLDGGAALGKEVLTTYWTLPQPEPGGLPCRSPEDWVAGLEELLRVSIRLQMLADVPVGAFLSGGIDSSTVVSLMQSRARLAVKTFTIGFPDAPYDESTFAQRVADHLQTEHTMWKCTDSDLLHWAGELPRVYCEPFADDSQLPTVALARLARQQVTVSLSGDGGDELFHGYGRYEKSVHRWQQLRRHPRLGKALKRGIDCLSAVAALIPPSPLKRRCVSKLAKAREQWLPEHLSTLYRYRFSVLKSPGLFLREMEPCPDFFDRAVAFEGLHDAVSWLSYLDLNTYLSDDLLVKVDRAAMAWGLETRMPYLDHRVVEYAASMPDSIKRFGGIRKWPLRRILEKYVPPAITERPKKGFNTPLSRWLRGPLREWGEAQLSSERLRREGFFDPVELKRIWEQHQRGRDRSHWLWNFLMFQAWHEWFYRREVV